MRFRHFIVAGAILSSLGVAHAQTRIHVDPAGDDVTGNGTSAAPYQTISFAASAAPAGATLLLAAGTYGDAEQIVLGTKDLTIVGAGIGQTVVRPHATLTNSIERGSPPTPTVHRVVFLVDGPARVDLSGMTIDAAFRMPSTGRLHGVYYRNGADGTIRDVEITNCRANPINGVQGPVGAIIAGSNPADQCVVTFRECLVHEFGKNGITAFDNSWLILEHSTVRGAGNVPLGLAAQNCVQASFGARATIRFNRIADSRYLPDTVTATGILLFNAAANTVVEGNEISQCQSGCYTIQSPAANVAHAIRSNVITGAWSGTVLVVDQDGVVVTDNTLHSILGDELVYDDSSTNVWSGNNYSGYDGSGSYAIAGGTIVDPAPRLTCDELGTETVVAVGGSPVEVLALDLDGLFGPDFVTVDDGVTPTLTVGLHNGAGHTTTIVPFGNVDGRAVAIASGEFDGAAGTDVAVLTVNRPGSTTENKVYVFANTAGTLALLHTATLPASAFSPNDLAAGVLGGSGVADLVVADLGAFATPGALYRLDNDGTGTGFAASTLTPAAAFTAQVAAVVIAELDGNPGLDVAATEGDGAGGRVHLFTNDGAGALTAVAPIAVANNPTAIAAGDLDADGDVDLALASIGAAAPIDEGVVTVVRNDGLPGAFGLRTLRTDRGPAALAIGDLADDDDPDTLRRDLAVVNLAGSSVGLQLAFDGVGFATGSTCDLGVTPRSVALSDVDGDGYTDVLVADAATQSLRIFAGVPTPRVDLYGSGCPGTRDRIPQIRAVGAPAVPGQPNPTFGIAVSDARPFAVAVLNASLTPSASLGPCELLLGSIDVTWVSVTDFAGASGAIVPIPAAPPALQGVSLYFQWAILDAQGDFLSLAAFSPAMKIRVGN